MLMKTLSHLPSKLFYLIEFAVFYLWEVIISNLRVAREVLLPSGRMQPAVIEVDITGLSERQLLATANLITMTPGTLSLDVSSERQTLLVHSLYVDDADDATRELENLFKERIRRVF